MCNELTWRLSWAQVAIFTSGLNSESVCISMFFCSFCISMLNCKLLKNVLSLNFIAKRTLEVVWKSLLRKSSCFSYMCLQFITHANLHFRILKQEVFCCIQTWESFWSICSKICNICHKYYKFLEFDLFAFIYFWQIFL